MEDRLEILIEIAIPLMGEGDTFKNFHNITLDKISEKVYEFYWEYLEFYDKFHGKFNNNPNKVLIKVKLLNIKLTSILTEYMKLLPYLSIDSDIVANYLFDILQKLGLDDSDFYNNNDRISALYNLGTFANNHDFMVHRGIDLIESLEYPACNNLSEVKLTSLKVLLTDLHFSIYKTKSTLSKDKNPHTEFFIDSLITLFRVYQLMGLKTNNLVSIYKDLNSEVS